MNIKILKKVPGRDNLTRGRIVAVTNSLGEKLIADGCAEQTNARTTEQQTMSKKSNKNADESASDNK